MTRRLSSDTGFRRLFGRVGGLRTFSTLLKPSLRLCGLGVRTVKHTIWTERLVVGSENLKWLISVKHSRRGTFALLRHAFVDSIYDLMIQAGTSECNYQKDGNLYAFWTTHISDALDRLKSSSQTQPLIL